MHSEKLKLLVELSKEEAIIAKEQSTKSKQEAANTVKSESHELRKKRERRMAQESDQKQRIVDGIQSTRDNVKEVKQRVLLENKERVAEIEREKEAMLMRKRQQDKEERERRSELIKQIRAMELVVAASAAERTTKHIDITTTSGCGILGEMSILELQERLSLLKIQEAKEESERRERIVDGKRQKQQELFEKMKRVERFRSMERAREEQRSKSRESTVASVLSQRAATADLYGPTTKLSPMVSGVVENVKEKTAAVQDLQARLATLKTQRLSAQLPGRSSSVQDERRKKAAANSPGNPVPSSAVREMESSILGLVDRLL